MANISDLTALTTAVDGDLIPLTDVSDTSQDTAGSTKKITRANLLGTASASELSINDGLTASTADLNATTNFEETISATTSKVSIATAKSLNIVDNGGLELAGTAVTSTAAELNKLDGVTSSMAELNIVDDGDTTEKVLASTAKCSVYTNGNQTVNAAASDTIEFDVEDFDIGSNFNTGTYTFTTPVAGYYAIYAQCLWAAALEDSQDFIIRVIADGTNVAEGRTISSGTTGVQSAVTAYEYLAAAKTIHFVASNGSTSNETVSAAHYRTYANIYLHSV